MFDSDVIDGTPSTLIGLINYGAGKISFRDNPQYYDRARSTKTSIQNELIEKCNRIAIELFNDKNNAENKSIKNRLTQEPESYNDDILSMRMFTDSIREKLGNVTYRKKYMTWYDISSNLPEILSLLTGTSPILIRYHIEQIIKNSNYNMTVEEFSRNYLGYYYVPVGYSIKMLSCMPPAVSNFFKRLIDNGITNNFAIGNNTLINDTPYGQYRFDNSLTCWVVDTLGTGVDIETRIDIYICYALRLFVYNIYSIIYNKVSTVYRSLWTDKNASRNSLSEMLVAWTPKDIVFQNDNNREFPSFQIKGRLGSFMFVKPLTFENEDAIREHFKGNLFL